MEDEPRPVNADKKLNIMGTVLSNMGVGSGTSVVPMPGVNVRYEPVSLLDHCNQYLSNTDQRKGWFGESDQDMSLLPVGERRLEDDVLYHIVDYDTAPVPNCIVLGVWKAPDGLEREVKGIDVGQKSDLLFFLHTAQVHHPVTPDQRERMGASKRPFTLPEIMRYVVNYADGKSVEIPVVLEKHIDHWLRQNPEPLPGAQVTTTVKVPGLEGLDQNRLEWLVYQMNARRNIELPKLDGEDIRGVLYGMQVKNPRPDVEIESIDVVPGSGSRTAVPAVLGITLGRLAE
jgi:beta-galactosidase